MLEAFADTGAFNDRLVGEGRFVSPTAWSRRQPPRSWTARASGQCFTDGPYLETKEHLAASG